MSDHDPQRLPPPNPSAAPAYRGGHQPAPEHPQATMILVLGIVSLFVGVVGPVAWYLGGRARKEIEASGGAVGGGQQVTIGWILGIITSILLILALVVFVVIFVVVLGVFGAAVT